MGLLETAGGVVTGLTKILGIGQKKQDKRQVAQQEKLNDVNAKTAKEMADYEQNLKYDMWDKTNLSAQLQQAKKAGVSKAAAIGGGGTGTQGASVGSVGGGNAADAASTENANTNQSALGLQAAAQLGLLKAQKENIEADTENKKVDAVKKSGIDTEVAGQELISKKFTNELNKKIGVDRMVNNAVDAMVKLEAESGKAWDEYQAWQAGGFKEGQKTNDPNSPVAKAIRAGFEQAVTNLDNAKKEGNLKDAETAVKQFEAKMASEGIAPNSPWYVKFGADLLERVGLNPLKK